MTKEGILQVLSVLKLNYPASYRGITKEERAALYQLWMYQFSGLDDQTVKHAVQALISTNTSDFAPSIGAIKAMVVKLTQEHDMTEQEAWYVVHKAVKNCDMMNPEIEFEKLPEDLQRLVGSPQTLLEWAMMDTDSLHTVVASNFQRSYRTRRKQDAEFKALPQPLKLLIEETGKALIGVDD